MSNFNFNEITDFDSHISSSIPNYSELKNMVVSLSHHLILDGGVVADIGCSTGVVLEGILQTIPNITGIGVDTASNLFPKKAKADYLTEDLKIFTPKADLIISMFTLQFLPIERRFDLLQRIKKLNPNVTLIITEKVFMEDGKTQEMFTFSYYDYKSKSFTAQELLDKQKSIRTVMKPLTEKENLQMFEAVGFEKVTKFWQSFQFMGWILSCKENNQF